MIGMITPLVKGTGRKAFTALGLFWFGALASSTVVGAASSITGLVIRPALPERYWWFAIAGLAVTLAIADLGIGGLRTPGIRRQTCSWWWHSMGPTKSWLAWGAHLGLGVATIRVTSIYWLVIATVILLAPVGSGPVILFFYSTGLAAGIGAAVMANKHLKLQDGGARALLQSRPAIGVASSVLLTIFAVMVLATSG